MTYSDQVRAEVAARYGVPVRCKVKIIPTGVIAAAQADTPEPATSGRGKRPARSSKRSAAVDLPDGGPRFRQMAIRLMRSRERKA